MRLILAHPAGLWALGAIPLVLLIHFLQEKSRRVRSSTLFLLERVKPESVGGARIERLRNSVPLWLQLLAVGVVAWLLAEPRWIREDSRQTVVVVLDSSVSMSAFKKEARAMLRERLGRWSGAAARTDWHLLESAPRKPRLYAGTDFGALLDAFDAWEPVHGTHAPDAALFTARGLMRGNAGTIIFVSDRPTALPSDVVLLSAGEPIENVGFAGAEARPTERGTGLKWRALIKNYGRERQQREWWIEPVLGAAKTGAAGEKRTLQVDPGQTVTLEGEMPPDVERATLVLSPDRFSWDDRLPLQRPRPRVVRVAVRQPGPAGELMKKFFGVLNGVELSSLTPDLVIDELGTATEADAVQWGGAVGENGVLDPSWVAAEDHRLTRDLAWSGLLSGRPTELTLAPGDAPLLWKGGRLLALLRPGVTSEGREIQRLILNWDLPNSNASRLAALPVMLQRFVEMVRERKSEAWAGNFETGQELGVRASPPQAKLDLETDGVKGAFAGRGPERPGFFEVLEDGKSVLRGAAQFADTREADFGIAAPADTAEQRRLETAMKQSEADPWTPLWVLALLACLAGSWAWKGARVPRSRSGAFPGAMPRPATETPNR